MNPTPPYSIGTAVILSGQSNCGTVRFEITRTSDNQTWHKAETGQPNQTETWRTNETGSGNFEVCFVARGDGGWSNAARSCRSVYVEGSQSPPAGSQSGDNVRCWVNSLTVTPNQARVGHTFQMAGQGQCDGNVRAVRFTINGSPWGEYAGNTTSSTWDSTGSQPGSVRICFQATSGQWSQAAESCTTITLTQSGQASNDVSQGQPATNNQPGQTAQSNPDSQVTTNSGGSTSGNSSSNGSSSNSGGQGQSCNSLSRLSVGQIAVVSDATPDPLPLRSGPSSSNRNLVNVPVRTQLTIIGGPSCSGNLVWWETQYSGQTGWVAEVNGYNNYNLIPNGEPLPGGNNSNSGNSSSNNSSSGSSSSNTCAGALSPTLFDGDRGRVTYTDGSPTTMRDRPQGNVVARLPEGTEFDVESDPVCTDAQNGHLWWIEVDADSGQSGWVPFGYSGGDYWIEPVVTTTQSSQCRQGWTPPNDDGVSDMTWILATDFRIMLMDSSMLRRASLAKVATTTWYIRTFNGNWSAFQDWLRDEFLDEVSEVAEGSIGTNITAILPTAESFFTGSVADARVIYEEQDDYYQSLSAYDNQSYRCGNYVHVPRNLLDPPVISFPRWWMLWSNALPFDAMQLCVDSPETCDTLFN